MGIARGYSAALLTDVLDLCAARMDYAQAWIALFLAVQDLTAHNRVVAKVVLGPAVQ